MLYVKFNGELQGATEGQLTMSFVGELSHRRTTNLLGVMGSRGFFLKLAFLLSAGQSFFQCPDFLQYLQLSA